MAFRGDYFVLRSAAFEKRIKRCTCFDIFYSGNDALQLQIRPPEYLFLRMALFLKQKKFINWVITYRAQNNVDLKWMLQHGLDITGEKNGYDFIKNIAHHHLRSTLPLITQECLLLAGSKDRYVPQKRLKDMTKELIQAKRVVTKLFTEKTGGALHCQIDDIKPALEENTAFLTSRSLNVAHNKK